jgi:hypothetical protein
MLIFNLQISLFVLCLVLSYNCPAPPNSICSICTLMLCSLFILLSQALGASSYLACITLPVALLSHHFIIFVRSFLYCSNLRQEERYCPKKGFREYIVGNCDSLVCVWGRFNLLDTLLGGMLHYSTPRSNRIKEISSLGLNLRFKT